MAKGSLLSLVILFVVVAGLCAVGFVVYNIATDVGHTTRQKMEKRNISFSKDGMKVGVKERSQEQQGDSAQSLLVKVWNNSYFPNYKSKLGWMEGAPNSNPSSPATTPGAAQRKPYSRSSSSQTAVKKA